MLGPLCKAVHHETITMTLTQLAVTAYIKQKSYHGDKANSSLQNG